MAKKNKSTYSLTSRQRKDQRGAANRAQEQKTPEEAAALKTQRKKFWFRAVIAGTCALALLAAIIVPTAILLSRDETEVTMAKITIEYNGMVKELRFQLFDEEPAEGTSSTIYAPLTCKYFIWNAQNKFYNESGRGAGKTNTLITYINNENQKGARIKGGRYTSYVRRPDSATAIDSVSRYKDENFARLRYSVRNEASSKTSLRLSEVSKGLSGAFGYLTLNSSSSSPASPSTSVTRCSAEFVIWLSDQPVSDVEGAGATVFGYAAHQDTLNILRELAALETEVIWTTSASGVSGINGPNAVFNAIPVDSVKIKSVKIVYPKRLKSVYNSYNLLTDTDGENGFKLGTDYFAETNL
ncbi:MAG: hypothetical protein FWE62_00125 [Firmicutes bacterium]|nr:hypothetical protein [Bacillota bacterium]